MGCRFEEPLIVAPAAFVVKNVAPPANMAHSVPKYTDLVLKVELIHVSPDFGLQYVAGCHLGPGRSVVPRFVALRSALIVEESSRIGKPREPFANVFVPILVDQKPPDLIRVSG